MDPRAINTISSGQPLIFMNRQQFTQGKWLWSFYTQLKWQLSLSKHLLCASLYAGFLFIHSFIYCFLGLQLRHKQDPRLGAELELQPQAYATGTAMQDPSHSCNLHPSSPQHQIPTHWASPGIKPVSSWILVGFVTAAPKGELHAGCFMCLIYVVQLSRRLRPITSILHKKRLRLLRLTSLPQITELICHRQDSKPQCQPLFHSVHGLLITWMAWYLIMSLCVARTEKVGGGCSCS